MESNTFWQLQNLNAYKMLSKRWYKIVFSEKEEKKLVWFLCLMAYQPSGCNAKAILAKKKQKWYYLTHSWEDKRVHAFPKGINPKVNLIARLKFELTCYNVAVQNVSHYTTKTCPSTAICGCSSGGDHGIHCWCDLIRSKQLSSVSVCRT